MEPGVKLWDTQQIDHAPGYGAGAWFFNKESFLMNIQDLKKILLTKSPVELFGDQGKDHQNYRKWALVCHPDRNDDSEESKCVFALLEEKARSVTTGVTISSKKGTYILEKNPIAKGDICDIYLSTDRRKLLKIARKQKFTPLMKNEEDSLKKIIPVDSPNMSAFLPAILDSFIVPMTKSEKVSVHVMGYDSDFISLVELHKVYNKLDPRHFAWIFKRILMGISIVHHAGFIHGSIMPQHILVNKVNHDSKLIDFIHCVELGNKIKVKTKTKDFYPPEILDDKIPGVESDIYMAGKVGVYLLGGDLSTNIIPNDVPRKIRIFLSALLIQKQKGRPNDALYLYDNFVEILESVFGKPKFVELKGV